MRQIGKIGWAKSYALERQEKALRYIRTEGREAIQGRQIPQKLVNLIIAISSVENLPRVEAEKLQAEVWGAMEEICRGRSTRGAVMLSTVEVAEIKRRLRLSPSHQTFIRRLPD